MQAAEDRSTPDLTSIGRLNLSRLRTVLLQPEVSPVSMVVVELLVENPP
jgi:hypothetical protein